LRRVRAYIGLGANVGDVRSTLTQAVQALGALPGATVHAVSSLYRTKPVGLVDQPDFLNAVAALDVQAGPDPARGATKLLVQLKDLERAFGRRAGRRWGPRELDLDLLLFGRARLAIDRPADGISSSAAIDPGAAASLLVVPHPSMLDRLFVLAPLADLAPALVPPGWDEPVARAAARRRAVDGSEAVLAVGTWSDEDETWVGPSGGAIEIERPQLRDADEMARVHTAAADAAYRAIAPKDPNGLARRKRLWGEILARQEHGSFVARDAARIVGVADVGPFRGDESTGALRVLYVLPPWWGTGAGQLLLERAQRELATKYDVAILTVLTANGRARRFYERNGWELAETLVEPHFDGVATEVCRYRRRLP
jgi:2-amino-4-hydroxy-6-hydroxymethyldihydropteridine diphosphokinase